MMNKFLVSCVCFTLAYTNSYSDILYVQTPSNEITEIEIDANTSFFDVISQLQALNEMNIPENNATTTFQIQFAQNAPPTILAESSPRDYHRPMTSTEEGDLRFILRTLATGSWASLLSNESSLERAGKRINHIHPLRFWRTICLNKELWGYVHVVNDRKKVWKRFAADCSDSLDKEAAKNNLTREQIDEFATVLKLKKDTLHEILKTQKWDTFYKFLFESLPREGDPGRYHS